MEYKKDIDFAVETIVGAGNILMKYFGKLAPSTPRDAVRGLLSEADLASDEYIRRRIENAFPDHTIYTEEDQAKIGQSNFTWFIDPLDGTTNFTHCIPDFVVYMALAKKESVILALAYNPITRELFHATKNNGSYLNNNPIKVSEKNLDESIVILANDYLFPNQRAKGLRLISSLTDTMGYNKQRSFRLRIQEGGLREVYVAKGAHDAFMIENAKPWDILAAALIVEEAGGKVTDHSGAVWNTNTKDILMTNGRIHTDLLDILRGCNA